MKRKSLRKNKNVLVWGTFDLLHNGHKLFLKKASLFGNLFVIIIPDNIVFQNKIRLPIEDAAIRKLKVERLNYVKQAFIDCIEEGLLCIDSIKPNILCFGYDQDKVWEDILLKELDRKGYKVLVKRLDKYANGIHTKNLIGFFETGQAHWKKK